MDLLLDTHVAIWWAHDPNGLKPDCRAAISKNLNSVWFSAASVWEMAIKARSGKLEVDVSRFVNQLAANTIGFLGIGIDDAITAGSLDWTHRDPFDRMLVTQAHRHGMILATRDNAIIKHLDPGQILLA